MYIYYINGAQVEKQCLEYSFGTSRLIARKPK